MRKYRDKIIKTELAEFLYKKMMEEVWNDEDYVLGVMAYLRTDEHRQKMIDILDTGIRDTDDIILYSLDIFDGLI